MKRKTRIYLIVTVLFIAGCVSSKEFNYEGIRNLSQLAVEQRRLGCYLKKQEALVAQLRSDILEGTLQKGMRQDAIIVLYGEPVVSRELAASDNKNEVFIYRHPTRFFSTDIMYLYFDGAGFLSAWSLLKAAD